MIEYMAVISKCSICGRAIAKNPGDWDYCEDCNPFSPRLAARNMREDLRAKWLEHLPTMVLTAINAPDAHSSITVADVVPHMIRIIDGCLDAVCGKEK